MSSLKSHKQIAEQLEYCYFSDLAPGGVFWLPKGMHIYNQLSKFWRELNQEYSYQEVKSPILYNSRLFEKSGHLSKFKENMFLMEIEGCEHGIKPMNCPAHIEIYKIRPRSYKELPLRLAEQGLVHRNEQSGAINGLLRARAFSIDDAHIFCREDQVRSEALACLEMARDIYKLFGLELEVELSLRPEKRLGSDGLWDRAEAALREALDEVGMSYKESLGEGAFYGPKIDLHIKDALARSWQLGSVQLDYQMPERFEIEYVGERPSKEPLRPIIVHRAMFGSFERFIGILLEHFQAKLPLWLSPEGVHILPVASKHLEYAREFQEALRLAGLPAKIYLEESLGKRISNSRKLRAPIMAVMGDQEVGAGKVMIRHGNHQESLALEVAISKLGAAFQERRLEAM